jgi:hypothetical protein
MKVGSLVYVTIGPNQGKVGLIIDQNELPDNHILKNYNVLVGDMEYIHFVAELEEVDVENWRSCRN